MRLFFILVLTFISTLAIAADTIYVSSLTNGTPPTLNVAKFTRPGTGPLNFAGSISLTLPKAGGVTSIQPNGDTQLHVYRTEQVGNKARIVRETVDLNTFTFVTGVAGASVAFPANLASIHNFDSNDAQAIVQKQTGKKLHTRGVNAPGNFFAGFRGLPSFPFAPFGSRISDGKPFFFSGLWIQPNSGRTGITFANVKAPFESTSFLFTNPILAQDVSLRFPRGTSSADLRLAPDVDDIFAFVIAELTPNNLIKIALRYIRLIRGGASNDGQIHTANFEPVGNVIQIAPPRSIRTAANAVSFQFNGVGIDPLGIAIVFLRWNAAQNTNEVILQTFNPNTGRKTGPPKFVIRAARNFIRYGISVFNTKFKNGVTND